jgi:hypothetical protein
MAPDIDIHGFITSHPEDSNKLGNIFQACFKRETKQKDCCSTLTNKNAHHYTTVHDRK